jgi:hypothetical protein
MMAALAFIIATTLALQAPSCAAADISSGVANVNTDTPATCFHIRTIIPFLLKSLRIIPAARI